MAKKKAEKPKREFTRRQLSRWQQQKKRQRIIFGVGILIIVAVLAVVGVGVYNWWYVAEYKPLHETVIEVNDTEFDMDYYVRMLEFSTTGLPAEYLEFVADEVVEAIEEIELVRQGAMELGISVSDNELDEAVDEALNSYDPPLSNDYRDVIRDSIRAGLLRERLLDEYFEEQVPSFAEQRHVWAMFLEGESQANEVKDRLEADETFAELAGELSLDDFSKENGGDLGWRAEGVLSLLLYTPIVDEYAFNCELGMLSEPIYDETRTKAVGYWLIEILERTEETEEEPAQARVKVMLLGSEQEANEVVARLEAGDDFAELASEYSQHDASKENGGEFEVSSLDTLTSAFSEFVFDPEVELGNLSQPIRDEEVSTEGGYWLVEVTGVDENRQIEGEDRDLLKGDAWTKWVEALWDDPENNIVSYLDEEKKQWAIMYVLTEE